MPVRKLIIDEYEYILDETKHSHFSVAQDKPYPITHFRHWVENVDGRSKRQKEYMYQSIEISGKFYSFISSEDQKLDDRLKDTIGTVE